MSDGIPIDNVTLTKFMNTPTIIRIVTVLDITSLSVLELFEYDINLGDIIFAMANRIVTYDNVAVITSSENDLSEIVPSSSQYFAFVRKKVKVTRLGLHILESIKAANLQRQVRYIQINPRIWTLAIRQQFLDPYKITLCYYRRILSINPSLVRIQPL